MAEGVSWRRDPRFDSSTDYGVDRRVNAPRPPPSHSSFGCDSPFVTDEAGRQIAAKRVVGLQFPAISTTSGMEGAEFGGTSGIN